MKSIFRILFTVIPLIILTNRNADAQNELDVIRNNWLEYSDAANSLYHHLTSQAFSLLKERENRISVFNTLIDWQKRQNYIRETLADIVGPFPEKTPLNVRIGITGRSGGGTQSAYLAAMDDRIYAAAPENYITNYTRLLQSIGPQDAEQNMFNLISRGMDHPDFLVVRAPKPALLITTTGDMFSIQGAVETENEVARVYRAYGKEENFSRIEDDAGHASTIKNREDMYAFFQKHLSNPGNPFDEETQPLTMEELRVTETDQISTSLRGETVFSLNRKWSENIVNKLNTSRENLDLFLPEVILSAKKLSGYLEPSVVEEPVFTGRIKRENYVIEKYFIKGEGNYVIPYLLFKPAKPDNRIMIYLHPLGKAAEASSGGEIEIFVSKGITVLAPDLIGTGETGSGALQGDAYFEGVSHNLWYASMLIGRSIAGIQAGDVVRLVRMLKKNNNEAEITGFARREMTPVLLHSAAFEPNIENIILSEPYSSFRTIVMNRFYEPHFILSAVPGALKEYDLPDLAGSLAPRRLFISGTTDGNGSLTDSTGIYADLSVIKNAFHIRKADNELMILPGQSEDKSLDQLMEWINKK
jgi:hypothetical protein